MTVDKMNARNCHYILEVYIITRKLARTAAAAAADQRCCKITTDHFLLVID